MDFQLLWHAFATVLLDPMNFLYALSGIVGGILVGALPGLTATMGCALLIPFTFGRPPIQGLLMLIGIFCGGIYGGSISGILIRTPGTPAAAATLLDGHPLAQQGMGGKAIGMATIASFFGGTIGALIMTFLSPQIAKIGLKFGPAEFFALAFFGLGMIITVSGRSLLKGFISTLVGLLISTIGFDPTPYRGVRYVRIARFIGRRHIYSGPDRAVRLCAGLSGVPENYPHSDGKSKSCSYPAQMVRDSRGSWYDGEIILNGNVYRQRAGHRV